MIALHTIEETLAIVARIRTVPDADLHRAATGLSLKTVLSLAVLVGQLDELARAAAAHVAQPKDLAAWADLQERLIKAVYLPLPQSQEPSHGEG